MPYAMPSPEMLACLKDCGECASMCARCAHHCLHMGKEHAAAEHQGIMRDCTSICELAACFLSRASPHAAHLCDECVEICNECAESCDSIAHGDAMMKQCATICRKCAQACTKMATADV